MSEIAYEPVSEPPDPVEAFARDDSAAAQAQAAVLLTLAWRHSGDDVPFDLDEDVIRYVVRQPPAPSEVPRVAPEAIAARVGSYGDMSFDSTRQRLFLEYREQPDPVTAAALFRLSMDSPDPLVRVAAATGYLETGLEPERALEILGEGAESQVELVRSVAQTSIGNVAPELQRPQISGLDDEGPSQPLESTLLIHGTFARRESWWRSGGDFHDYLLNSVFADLYSATDAFSWSGAYSDAARVLGASDLVAWLRQRESGPVSLVTHSHGGSVAMLASWAPVPIARLVLLSCPVHWSEYHPDFNQVGQAASVRVHLDLVILADRGGQRFRVPQIKEHVLPLWFQHSATHDPNVWQRYGVPALLP